MVRRMAMLLVAAGASLARLLSLAWAGFVRSAASRWGARLWRHRLGMFNALRRHPQMVSRIAAGLTLTLVALALTGSIGIRPAAAGGCGSVAFSYDAAGRLVGASDKAGNTAQYRYDAAGNTTAVNNLGAPPLSVLSFTPTSGAPGTAVTISGGCFSPVATDNTVSFGGVPAVVVSASPYRLVATVPAGAGSGAITVSVGGQTVTTTDVFVVDAAANAPSIASVSPTLANAGDTLTIAGANFIAAIPENRVNLNATRAVVQSASSTSVAAQVPAATMSGRVRVATVYGSATSIQDVFIPPAPYTVADVAATGRVSVGTASTVSIGLAGKVGLFLFDLQAGQRASLQLSSGSFGSCGLNARIYSPRATSGLSEILCVASAWSIEAGLCPR